MFKSIKRRLSNIDTGTPSSDVALPENRERRRVSNARLIKINELKNLPLLKDTAVQKRELLFKQKLDLCSVVFDFDILESEENHIDQDRPGKELKRETLMELVEWVNTSNGQKLFTETTMCNVVEMIKVNIFRSLPPRTNDFDPEEDEPVLEPAWSHLQVVYEFLLRFVVSSEVHARTCKKYIDQNFCVKIIELFDSEDPRERDYLKTILHRIYGKFMSHRSFIRRSIQHVFYHFVFETERHNGIGELLEILGSIVNGFALPIKKEHVNFLRRALMPLHKPKCVGLYQQQLTYCVTQYVEKDAETSVEVVKGIIKYWPWSSSTKQVLFINELEEVLELTNTEQIEKLSVPLFGCISRCLSSDHFQVAERALFLWNNEHLYTVGCFCKEYSTLVLPTLYGPLYRNSQSHWNNTVESLSQNVLKTYMDYDMSFFDKIHAEYLIKIQSQRRDEAERERKWDMLDKLVNKSNIL